MTVKNYVFLINDTTINTYYPITSIVQRCHEYIANVTAFSSEYHGDSVVYKEKPLGGVCVCVCVRACVACVYYVYLLYVLVCRYLTGITNGCMNASLCIIMSNDLMSVM